MPAPRRPAAIDSLRGLITGYWASQLIFVAAKLNLADVLATGPMKAEAIAKEVGAHGPSLYRILRTLAGIGIFAEDSKGRFKLTPMAQFLRSDHPTSLLDYVLMIVDDYNWQAWGDLMHTAKTGETAFEHVFKMPGFEYLAQHPHKERAFSAAMASVTRTHNRAIVKTIPLSGARHIVDVGGAHGNLLTAILRRHKKLRGTLFDLPQVVAAAPEAGFVSAPEIEARCELAGGDFFDSVPEGADAYVMKSILHDWDDDSSVKILANCRKAMAKDGRIFIVDYVIPKGNGPHPGKFMDVNMMALAGGKERTKEEFAALLKRARLKLSRVIPTDIPLSIVEAMRV
jgi:SAM-dependent methyltransferase